MSVQWTTNAVFAGDFVGCTITFKNVSLSNNLRRSPSPNTYIQGKGSHREHGREILPPSTSNNTLPHLHQRSLSAMAPSHLRPRVYNISSWEQPNGSSLQKSIDKKSSSFVDNKHRRSVSVVSISNDAFENFPARAQPQPPKIRPVQAHARAGSLQDLPKSKGLRSTGRSSSRYNAFD